MTAEQDPPVAYPTSLGTSDAATITLLGHDLAADLMGQVGFGELALWLVTQRRPSPSHVRVFEAVLVALADHGFTPTAIAARLTYLSAPDSVQGAVAAGLLGQLAEEQRRPVAMDVYLAVDRSTAYVPPD